MQPHAWYMETQATRFAKMGLRAKAKLSRDDTFRKLLAYSFVAALILIPYVLTFALYFRTGDAERNTSGKEQEVLSGDEPTDAPSTCSLSTYESRGFFCESDAAWKRRRIAYAVQQTKQIGKQHDTNFRYKMGHWWQQNYEVGAYVPQCGCFMFAWLKEANTSSSE